MGAARLDVMQRVGKGGGLLKKKRRGGIRGGGFFSEKRKGEKRGAAEGEGGGTQIKEGPEVRSL